MTVTRPAGLSAAALVIAAVTLLLYPLQEVDPGVSSGVLYVLGVLLVSVYWGLWLGLVTSAGSALALYYFHTDPVGFHVKSAGDTVAIATLLATASVASVIADTARRREGDRIRHEELRASRARVLEAADAERRRLVRDLHDGAQQRLVHTVVTLKLALRALVRHDDEAAPELVREALAQAQQGTTELRELAHGILPPVLTRGGLRAGVEALASRMPVPVEITVPRERLPTAVESTAYFVVAEALTNVVKHSRADSAQIAAGVKDGALRLQVRDDGVGGAHRNGGGLVGLEDRVAVLNGSLAIDSPPGGGTVVAAVIPIGG